MQVPYDSAWMKLGNIGDHIGPMARPFAREVIAPLLLTGKLPVIKPESERADSLKLPPPMPTSTTAPTAPSPPSQAPPAESSIAPATAP